MSTRLVSPVLAGGVDTAGALVDGVPAGLYSISDVNDACDACDASGEASRSTMPAVGGMSVSAWKAPLCGYQPSTSSYQSKCLPAYRCIWSGFPVCTSYLLMSADWLLGVHYGCIVEFSKCPLRAVEWR